MKRPPPTRRGVSLIETIIVIVVLAVSVPSAVAWLDEAAARRADAVNAVRATAMAQCVTEHVLADCSSTSSGLGFAALANSAAYLNTPTTGLRDRLASQTAALEAMGFSYTVGISALHDSAGVVNADASQNLFRTVTVTVTYASAGGQNVQVAVATRVTQW